jgi:hypothetical protein
MCKEPPILRDNYSVEAGFMAVVVDYSSPLLCHSNFSVDFPVVAGDFLQTLLFLPVAVVQL